MHDTTPAVTLKPKKLTDADHEARNRKYGVLLYGHVYNYDNLMLTVRLLCCRNPELVVVNEVSGKVSLFSGRAAKHELHITRHGKVIALRVKLAEQVYIRFCILHQGIKNRHMHP